MSCIENFDKVEKKKYGPSPQKGSKDNQLAIRDIPTKLKTSLDRVGSIFFFWYDIHPIKGHLFLVLS